MTHGSLDEEDKGFVQNSAPFRQEQSFVPSWRALGLMLMLLAASACGGGGGGSDDDDNAIGLGYVGNRSAAVLAPDNVQTLTANVLATDAFGYALGGNVLGARAAPDAAPPKLSLVETALLTQRFARRSLELAGIVTPGIGARTAARNEVDDTEFCESGLMRITGAVEDDLTGELEIDLRQCRYGQVTMNGRIRWTLHAVDQLNLVPTHSTFRIMSLTVATPLESASLGGVIVNQFDFFADSEWLDLRNLIVRNNADGYMTMASGLRLRLQYDDIGFPNYVEHNFLGGRVYDSIHGYVEVVSPQPLRFEDIYDDRPSSGLLQLTAIGRLTVTAQPGQLVQFSLDTDQPPDGVPEFDELVHWDSVFDPGIPGDEDLDDDNISNTWELANGLDPLEPADARQDFDFDGFDNLAEFLHSTDPNDGGSMPPLPELWRPSPGSTPASGNFVYLESDPDDFIGGGATSLYTDADAVLAASTSGARLTVTVTTTGAWSGQFLLPIPEIEVTPGYHGQVLRYPFHEPNVGGLSWTGMGRGCNQSIGWFIVDAVSYENDQLKSVELRFGQHCENGVQALRGQLRWVDTPAPPPPPPPPPPGGLWQPAPGATPASGNYIYLESEAGDFIGQGATYLYTDADAVLTFNAPNARLNVAVNGDESWSGTFQSPDALTRIEAGYFGDLARYPFHNPVLGGLSWSGEGRGCNTLNGWFAVDSVTYAGSTMTAIELRFEQDCGGSTGVLHGKLRWDVNDVGSPPGPIEPPPPGLWQAPAGVLPASGNYIYLESQAGDFIGQGGVYLYTSADTILGLQTIGARLNVDVNGDEDWRADFQAMNTLARLEPGYYGNLERYPFHNPTRGGLSWSGEGRGCNTLSGWFAVDSVSYDGTDLAEIRLRFEQRCDSSSGVLRGQLYWSAANPTDPPGPLNPPPGGLWQPAAGATPASGNYIYLESAPGDYIGQGGTYLYTSADTTLTFSDTGGRLDVGVNGAERWNATFQTMLSLVRFETGYYGNLQRWPFHNPVRGGLSWSGEGRGCNRLAGWFVVDSVTYTGIDLTALELRFEQRCEETGPPLNGKLRWSQ